MQYKYKKVVLTNNENSPSATVAIFGSHQPVPQAIRLLAIRLGAKNVCLIKAPATSLHRGFKEIVPIKFIKNDETPDVYAEGVFMGEAVQSRAAIIKTKDCPTLVLHDKSTGSSLLTHAGRAAMTPSKKPDGSIENIVTTAFDTIKATSKTPSQLQACIMGSICGHCFTHEQSGADEFVRPFVEHFGEWVFANRKTRALDLVEIITRQLVQLGLHREHIFHDGLCTYEESWLSSHRQGTGPHNIVMVVKH